jgi:hypothetical protein
MNRRTAEQGTAEYRSKKDCLTAFKKLLLFEIPCSTLSFGLPTLRAGPQFRYSKYETG